MRMPQENVSGVYHPKFTNCPLKRCDYLGRSTLCYVNKDFKDCKLYNDLAFVEDFVTEFRRSEGSFEE